MEITANDVILTGDRPTGKLHLGHYVGSLKNRLDLQYKCKQFVMIADLQALTDHAKQPQIIKQSILEVMLDYLALGLDPKKTTIFLQSGIPAISELTMYYMNLVTINRVQHNPTVKAEIKQKGFKEGVPAGFVMYPISQAADITAFAATLVPVGSDQLPMIEQTNEIVKTFNRIYNCDVLVKTKALLPKIGQRLPGIDGGAKMSKSLGNAIYLSDDEAELEKKIKKMYTDPNHLRVDDPGKIEGNIVFDYLDIFDSNQARLMEMKAHYQRGGLADSVVKKHLFEVLNELLSPIRKRREQLAKDPAEVLKFLKEGTISANHTASNVLKRVKEAMHMLS